MGEQGKLISQLQNSAFATGNIGTPSGNCGADSCVLQNILTISECYAIIEKKASIGRASVEEEIASRNFNRGFSSFPFSSCSAVGELFVLYVVNVIINSLLMKKTGKAWSDFWLWQYISRHLILIRSKCVILNNWEYDTHLVTYLRVLFI